MIPESCFQNSRNDIKCIFSDKIFPCVGLDILSVLQGVMDWQQHQDSALVTQLQPFLISHFTTYHLALSPVTYEHNSLAWQLGRDENIKNHNFFEALSNNGFLIYIYRIGIRR